MYVVEETHIYKDLYTEMYMLIYIYVTTTLKHILI